MTNPDFRALCAELVETWDATADSDFKDFGLAAADIVYRARAALAQPAPVALTDDELIKTYCDARRDFYFKAAIGRSDQEDRKAATIAGLRAVLARYGTLSAVPVDKKRFEKAPCYLCGYNGPGYYQPNQHPCAVRYHRVAADDIVDPIHITKPQP